MVVPGKLSPRQRKVYELVARGRSALEIAGELEITVRSVEYHITKIKISLALSGPPMKAIMLHAHQPSLL